MSEIPFTVTALDHVVLRVGDMARALAFYCDLLGCPVERRIESIGLVQLRAGSALIDLVPSTSTDPVINSQNMDHFCIRIRPFQIEALKQHLGPYLVGDVEQRYGAQKMGQSLYVKDPDGNVVELKEELQMPD
jgi:glyoxylase I family protein